MVWKSKWIELCKTPAVYFLLSLLVKLYIVRYMLFQEHNPLHTLYLELPILIVLFAFTTILFRKANKYVLFALNILLSAGFIGIVMYFAYFGKIFNYFALLSFKQVDDVHASVNTVFNFRYLFFFIDIPVLFAIMVGIKKTTSTLWKAKWVVPAITICCVLSGLQIISTNSTDKTTMAENIGILNYTAKESVTKGEVALSSNIEVNMNNIDLLNKLIVH